MRHAPVTLIALLTACTPDSSSKDEGNSTEACTGGLVARDWYLDADGDGYGTEADAVSACELPSGYAGISGDCDDTRPDFNPGAEEADCTDPEDYNCDGSTVWEDSDGDGSAACEDCDDDDDARSPQFSERCDDADIDEDCDGLADDADDIADGRADWWPDVDDDSYGDATEAPRSVCDPPAGFVTNDQDCNDAEGAINPDGHEVCDAADADEDCNGAAEDADAGVDADTMITTCIDLDGDGHGSPTSCQALCDTTFLYVEGADDCDDSNSTIYLGAAEHCDGEDDDCDGLTDDDDADVVDATAWYADLDSDGYGAGSGVTACSPPFAWIADGTDCDDLSGAVHPGASEQCDAADTDEDCNGVADDADAGASGQTTWYVDADADGYGVAGPTLVACETPAGYADNSGDCDDADSAIRPSATEVCDAIDVDEDCDGLVDDDDDSVTGQFTWYADDDGDTFGDAFASVDACTAPADTVSDATDCDDSDAAINPDATEVCDAALTDEDCDGASDDDDASVTLRQAWYRDADGDLYGAAATTTLACLAPAGYIADNTDCDDTESAIHPGGSEVCDPANDDEDCDGRADDSDSSATGQTTWYRDVDLDGHGVSSPTRTRCDASSGYADLADDCDDGEDTVFPGARELCYDDIDNDCDSVVDESCGWAGTYDAHADADMVISGTSGSRFGRRLATAFDFNGDGLDDLAVGAFDGGTGNYGVAYVYAGPLHTTSHGAGSYTFAQYTGTSTYVDVGIEIAGINDLDGDGDDEMLVASTQGSGKLILGNSTGGTSALSSSFTAAFTCSEAASGGYTQGTSTVNWICGYSAYGSNSGEVVVYGGTSTTALATMTGTSSSKLGYSVDGGEDVDGDGLDDVLAGAEAASSGAGAAYLLYGPASSGSMAALSDVRFTGAASDAMGSSVQSPGDMDLDGYGDVVIGAGGDDDGGSNAGAVFVFYGPFSSTEAYSGADAKLTGTAAYDDVAYDGLSVGDSNGDGHGDVVVGGIYADSGGSSSGAAWVVYGDLYGTYAFASGDYDMEIAGSTAGDYLGGDVGLDADYNGDGLNEIILGAQHYSSSSGMVAVFDGI